MGPCFRRDDAGFAGLSQAVDRARGNRHGARVISPRHRSLPHMFTLSSLWIPFTIVAAFGQVARSGRQRQLPGPLGTWGATNIRFLFGLPFSIVFFALAVIATGD